MRKKFFTICFVCILATSCNDKSIELFVKHNQTPVFVCLYYSPKVLVFDENDYFHGKFLLDYNSNIGKQFAAKNQIKLEDYNVDYKFKFNEINSAIQLPDTSGVEMYLMNGGPDPQKTKKKLNVEDKNKSIKNKNEDGDNIQPAPTNNSNQGRVANGGEGTKSTNVDKKSESEDKKKKRPSAMKDFGNVDDDLTIVDETTDKLIKLDFIYEPLSIAEFNLYNEQGSALLLEQLSEAFGKYNVELTDDLNALANCQTKLLVAVVKYRPGQYNLITDLSSRMTVIVSIVNERLGINVQFAKTYSQVANINYPNEMARLEVMMSKLVADLTNKLERIVISKSVTFDNSSDATSDNVAN